MNIIDELRERWLGVNYPFLIHPKGQLRFSEIYDQKSLDLSIIEAGDVVALIGDFDPKSILTLLELIDKKAILVPLTKDTRSQHEYFFKSALVDVIIEDGKVKRIEHEASNNLITTLKLKKHAGLVLFSTGTTGRPKAILHDLTIFMKRFQTQRPTLKTINFLLFDHIGGLNTLLHTLFNKGTVVAPETRDVETVLKTCAEHQIEVLPTTPTFLRMMLMSGLIPSGIPDSLKVITYGTERMDQPTLDALCGLLPNVDFRQTFGMSELGILRVKSEAKNSLYMMIGGEGVETKVVDRILKIRSESRMLGYLNAESPFDKDGWYDTSDIVDEKDGYYCVTGRTTEVINVGGLKFMASEVERVALEFNDVKLCKAFAKPNPITGEHVELIVQLNEGSTVQKSEIKHFLSDRLEKHMMPKRLTLSEVSVGHRFKRF